MSWLLVLIGAALGAPLRYLVDRTVQARHASVFPWGTWTVNTAASLLLGVLAGTASSDLRLVVGTGFCGALSTYSTFGYETLRLAEDGAVLYAAANVLVGVVGGLGAATIGIAIGRTI
ncbi:CrcB family protein [Frankia sp. Cppng1_Ct_nod]|uniref:fluoride efflux transporter FluC n=1 Tax=Frankia sp. Cppng1_Ct_nod TaxID=2897162 RepID=UPI001040E87A|nr:CrcB family protein [Frankia sp. Cppng1_Ct_nod]